IRSEWTKIRSVRSTMWSLAVTGLLMVGLSALLNGSARVNGDGPLTLSDALSLSVAGELFATISLAALRVLVISSEYRTGGIRTSLMAVPNRYKLLTGKLIVVTATALVAGAVFTAAAIAVGLPIAQPTGFDLAEVVRAGVGNTLYLTACGLF